MDQKRTIEELHAIYVHEPEIRDIFVEGSTDKAFLDWYISKHGWKDIAIYPVDLIEVPDNLLTSHKLPLNSNRARLIALSRELSTRLPEQRCVMCIVDRDSDDQIEDELLNPYLFFTDGNSLELYAMDSTVVEKFLHVTLGGFPLSADTLISEMLKILQRVFAIRRTNAHLRWGMTWIPFCHFVNVKKFPYLTFRELDFMNAYLQNNGRWSERKQFQSVLNDVLGKMSPDIRRTIRGHDLSELLRLIIIRVKKTRIFGNYETVEGCLMTAIETKDLNEQPLFITFREKMTSSV
jgi:hypothetical protein